MPDPDNTLAALDAATARYDQTKAAHKDARADAIQKALAALKAGKAPTEVARRSPFSEAYVRKLAREAGIPPAPPGIKPEGKPARRPAT